MDGYLLPPVSLSLHEAMALFLASRLVLKQVDESNPHIQAALEKLSGVLPALISSRMRQSIDAIGRLPANKNYVAVYETVAIAWSTQRAVRIRYQSANSSKVRIWHLEPYFVDMTGIGHSMYVIGHARRKEHRGLRTFKLDRIRSMELLDQRFDIPGHITLDMLLAKSWGVMWGDECDVRLRFSPAVSRRVKESVWHPAQVIEDEPGGWCVLSLRVANVLEMTPWIRSWGPEVEVLEPQSLRQEFAGWARRLWGMYGGSPARDSG